ncbi:hypothetical protein LH435_10595 [Laribacter hongkongensis]|uniref:hypothetical protein n=1 Tax=Laribacter hongkongensis TaxID=168471 RepID=UPI001EFD9FC7|nr:hypothetical protein [Laribacter hongkongensis]MCG9011084.1 hypothetical protein [Laribacter hongkongensis]MCG9023210.1 hypothetical protein [Laribacter hongkongensis]MCG9074437.1 hypothetical protein [Laribacter hongkongensis]
MRDLEPTLDRPVHKPFKAYDLGYFHIDVKYLPQMPDESARCYLFVAIDQLTFVQIKPHKMATAACAFLSALLRAVPCLVRTILTE